jgi:hypothetical protein
LSVKVNKTEKAKALIKLVRKDNLATFIKSLLLASSNGNNNMFWGTNIVIEDNGNITIFDMEGKIKEYIEDGAL